MPVSELLMEGVWLMLLGMGIVFTFLVVLVFVLYGMSHVTASFGGERPAEPAPAAAGAPVPPEQVSDNELIAVISAAVTRYRATRR